MTLAARITRHPIAHDPDRGDEALAALPDLEAPLAELIRGTAGCSPFLHGLILRDRDWLVEALPQPVEDVRDALLGEVAQAGDGELGATLRIAKRRMALWIALADLGGAWALEDVTGSLTQLADLATDRALAAALRAQAKRGRLPGLTEETAAEAAAVTVLAMGKMGACELNYSSDIDLIVLFDDDRYETGDLPEVRAGLIRATRAMAATLSEITREGYVFRTDLRLRPDAAVTPVCLSMEAAERYYESVGRTWERAAYIKARPCAGDIKAGEAFLKRLTPFVWRRHLDFAAIQDAHDMRLRIRQHKGLHGGHNGHLTLEGHDMKLGAGGIREIEFFTQTRQIIAGGRDPDLRHRGTLRALAALTDKGWVPGDVSRTLAAAYRAHREIEHRIQMTGDLQEHRLPQGAEGITRLAHFTGTADVGEFRAVLAHRLREVHALTEDFFAPTATETPPQPAISEKAMEITERWPNYPALRSARAAEVFGRVKPQLLSRLARAADPDDALLQLDRFLAGLPAGVQLFSLFEANPPLQDLIVDIAATAPALSQYLSQNAGVLDAVIGGAFFSPWPGAEALEAQLSEALATIDDYERRLDQTRRWHREWHFRTGVHHLRGLLAAPEAEAQYADLAEATVAGLLPCVTAEFSRRHGPPPGRGLAVVGMGSLGARTLTSTSDLDLIVIYDPAGAEASDGPKSLPARTYYARLTQALVTALTVPMPEGRLYEVDMRLRPSGKQGPVATALSAYTRYQREEAWTWEHLALTRARPIAGAPDLCDEIEDFRRETLRTVRKGETVLADVAEMRARLAAAHPQGGPWDLKRGPGGVQDIELLANAAALLAGSPARGPEDQLAAGQKCGWLSGDDTVCLRTAYGRQRALLLAARLLTTGPLDPDQIGEGGRNFLLRESPCESLQRVLAMLDEDRAKTSEILERALP